MGSVARFFDRFLPTTPHEPKADDLVELATFSFQTPADQLVMFLGEAGIRGVVYGGNNAASVLSYGLEHIRVMIRYDDLEEARQVLVDFETGAV